MEKTRLQSVFFEKLKGLENVNLVFEKPLTAIMGVNGAGKTTVLHALACAYQPDGGGEDHRFPEFFVPNTDALWKGSRFEVVNAKEVEGGAWEPVDSKRYAKDFDRWAPRYDKRPRRNVYYIGIDTCLPEIEKTNITSRIIYSSKDRSDKTSQKVLRLAAEVLNIDYKQLIDNEYNNRHFLGVCTQMGLRYSSLSMGTGEQRTIRILEKVLAAEAYSLILVDEIDLLLHVSALKMLIEKLYYIAEEKKLQIVFTTHSLEMITLTRFVGVQYLDVIHDSDDKKTYFVYDKPTDDIIRGLTGTSSRPIEIYVEDEYSAAIIKSVLRKLDMARKTEVKLFGTCTNAFSLAAGLVLTKKNLSNCLIVLDGDRYCSEQEKDKQIKKTLSGTEHDAERKRAQAVALILQYNLPADQAPEEFMFSLLCSAPNTNEIAQIAREIRAVGDRHDYIRHISEQLDEDITILVPQIVSLIEKTKEWETYISPVESWLQERKDI